MHRRLPEVTTLLVLAIGIVLFAPALDSGTNLAEPVGADVSALDKPRLVFDRRAGRLLLEGTSASSRHEDALLQIANSRFSGSEVVTDLRPGVVLPDYWEPASMQLLHALAATESAVAVIEDGQARIRGVTSEPDALQSRLASLRRNLSPGMRVVDDVAVIGTTASLDELCRLNFANAVTEPVAFRQSSAELRTSSYALLDKIIDIADDCRTHRIAITGHSDASGDEHWNRKLSRARAQAVADYLVRGGIQPQRLTVDGVGSAEPVADNATAYGRSRNRRIEFELR